MSSVDNYKNQYNKLTQTLMEEFLKEKQGENLVLSPYSVIMLLGIAAHATDNTTRAEILNAVAPGMDIEQAGKLFSELQKIMSEQPELISSNAVCVRADLEKTIRTDYPRELAAIFDGKLFASTNLVDDVNAWVKEHTKGMIDQIVDDSAANMLACLLNAIAFEADWAEKYEEDDIYEDDFTNADGSKSEVSYLYSTEEIFVENEFFKGFIKPYKNEEFSFMALLPKKKKSPSFLLRAIKAIDFSKLFEEAVDMTVYATMPEFKYDFRKDLTGLCQKLGIHEAFTNAADFSNVSSADLNADSILHKAHIEVDRKGTKAAAVTSMVVVAGCAPMEREYEEICLDRPFVYAIMNNKTGLPVFTGITNQI